MSWIPPAAAGEACLRRKIPAASACVASLTFYSNSGRTNDPIEVRNKGALVIEGDTVPVVVLSFHSITQQLPNRVAHLLGCELASA